MNNNLLMNVKRIRLLGNVSNQFKINKHIMLILEYFKFCKHNFF